MRDAIGVCCFRRNALAVVAGACCVGGSTTVQGAVSAEFRLVERTGQSQVSSSDTVLDIAVQGRLIGGGPSGPIMGTFAFDIVIPGELENRGTLAKSRISNADGTYFNGIALASQVGVGGVARQYSYLAGINANLNCLINVSGSTFTNTPIQEIGAITGGALGSALLGTPDIDADLDGNPDTWSGNGLGVAPTNGSTAPIPSGIAETYLGRNEFVDLYRFRYTVSDLSTRSLLITLNGASAQQINMFRYANGLWGGSDGTIPAQLTSVAGLNISVVPAPGPAMGLLVGACGLAASRKRPSCPPRKR